MEQRSLKTKNRHRLKAEHIRETVLWGDRLPLWLPPDATQLHPGSKVSDCGWAGHSLSLEENSFGSFILGKAFPLSNLSVL